MNLLDLKKKAPEELLDLAEENNVENASNMRKQDLMFAILKAFGERTEDISG